MKLEIVYTLGNWKHMEHITEEGSKKIQFDDKGVNKLVEMIRYVNKYLASNNGKVINISSNNAEMIISLEVN